MKNLILLFSLLTITINTGYCQFNLGREGVGINKVAPAKGLDIKGGNGGNLKIDNAGEQYNDFEFLNNGTRRALVGLDNVSNVFRIASEKNGQDFSIQTGGFIDRLRIKSTGQIGIGMLSWQDYKVSMNADNVTHPLVLYNDKNQLSFIDFWNASTGINAGVSNRFVTNKPNTTDWNVASIDKYRSGLWAFRNYDSNGKIEFDVQGIVGNTTPELVIENDGGVRIPNAAIKFGGTPIAGSMRWTGTDFEGYNGSQWKSLLNNQGPPSGYWAVASSQANCSNVCASGYAPGTTTDGFGCKNAGGVQGYGAVYLRNEDRNTGGNIIYWDWNCLGDQFVSNKLAQCYCIRVVN